MPYLLSSGVEMLFQQVQLNELIDWPQAIWRKLCSFLKSLTGFVISLGLAQSQSECHLGLWIAWRELCLFAGNDSCVVEAIERAVCGCQEQRGRPQFWISF